MTEINVQDWLFPDGGVWILFSNDHERPCLGHCNPDNPEESEIGIICFASQDRAKHFLETIYQSHDIDLSSYPIRYVKAGDLCTWLDQVKKWAPYLLWHMGHEVGKAIIHVSVPIADLLFDDDH